MIYEFLCYANETVYKALKRNKLSENIISRLRKTKGLLQVNDVSVTMRYKFACESVLKIFIIDKPNIDVKAVNIPLDIVYEDEYLIVLNKQVGLAVMPTKAHFEKSLYSALTNKYGKEFCMHVVTRLDRDTSGLMLIAKDSYVHSLFNFDLKNSITRIYVALVHGIVECGGTIDAKISRENDVSMKRIVSDVGDVAITHFDVIKQFENTTLLKLQLETGRTHQIRAHMNYIGHTLCGDKLYGVEDGYKRQCLHSSEIKFVHPITNRELMFVSYDCDFCDDIL